MSPLLSGNGRHRRPRQAPNFVVAAGVTGAGLAIPLLGATAANAADNTTWDAVAECESGGLWSANEDNGYYGGLQLDQATWEEHGGTDYAERPDLASRDQQITVAERVLDSVGTEPFGDCAQSAGLSQDSPGSPDVDPDGTEDILGDDPVAERPYPTDPATGAPEDGSGTPDPSESAEPSDPSESADPSESGDPAGSESPAPDDSTDPSDWGNSGDSGDSADSGGQAGGDDGAGDGGDYTYEPSDPVGPGDGTDGSSGDGTDGSSGEGSGDGSSGDGERPSRGGDGGRGDAGEDEQGGGSAEGGDYRVAPGDSLTGIAEEEDVRGGWERLYERNRDVIGSDPDLILPGQELRL